MSNRVELPIVTDEAPENKHVSLLLVADGLRQTEQNLKEQEDNIRKLTEQLQQLRDMRIATTAQKNLLTDLQSKIIELEGTQPSA
jgi:hypothetical protein